MCINFNYLDLHKQNKLSFSFNIPLFFISHFHCLSTFKISSNIIFRSLFSFNMCLLHIACLLPQNMSLSIIFISSTTHHKSFNLWVFVIIIFFYNSLFSAFALVCYGTPYFYSSNANNNIEHMFTLQSYLSCDVYY